MCVGWRRERWLRLAAMGCPRRGGRCLVAGKAKEIATDDHVDVLRKSFDELPALGKRCAPLERQMWTGRRQCKEFSQRPADPEILLNAGRRQTEPALGFFTAARLTGGRELNELFHRSTLSNFGDLLQDSGDPSRGVTEVGHQLLLVGSGKPSTE